MGTLSKVASFEGPFAFLSNFYPSPIVYEGQRYQTVEHAFQAAKSTDPAERENIRNAPTPGKAKAMGRRVTLRPDWERVKRGVMMECLRLKFADPRLAQQLLKTGEALLEEGNTWGDTYWGKVDGNGENWLGILLMRVREELRTKYARIWCESVRRSGKELSPWERQFIASLPSSPSYRQFRKLEEIYAQYT
jgi:ribA/ribD-fused uncharacterized protein